MIWEENAVQLPFYCAALACPKACPRGVHAIRVRRHASKASTRLGVFHSMPAPDNRLPGDHAFERGADDTDDPKRGEVTWEIVDDGPQLPTSW